MKKKTTELDRDAEGNPSNVIHKETSQMALDTLSIGSFSSDELPEENEEQAEDYISSFSSQESEPTTLPKRKQRSKGSSDKSKRQRVTKEEKTNLMDDILAIDKDDSDINISDMSFISSPIENFSSTEEEKVVEYQSRPLLPNNPDNPIPHFTDIVRPTVLLPKLPEYLRRRHIDKNGKKFIEFKKGGMAERVLSVVLQQRECFNEWEKNVNAMMAKYGSIVKVCNKSPDSHPLRLIDPWIERGLVFAWCVPLKESEILQVVGSATQENSQTSWNEGSQDIIEDFSQPQSLPPYEPDENEERFLMAFSFTHITTTVSKEAFVKKERCVGIWPPWTESEISIKDRRQKVYLITRFKSDVIY